VEELLRALPGQLNRLGTGLDGLDPWPACWGHLTRPSPVWALTGKPPSAPRPADEPSGLRTAGELARQHPQRAALLQDPGKLSPGLPHPALHPLAAKLAGPQRVPSTLNSCHSQQHTYRHGIERGLTAATTALSKCASTSPLASATLADVTPAYDSSAFSTAVEQAAHTMPVTLIRSTYEAAGASSRAGRGLPGRSIELTHRSPLGSSEGRAYLSWCWQEQLAAGWSGGPVARRTSICCLGARTETSPPSKPASSTASTSASVDISEGSKETCGEERSDPSRDTTLRILSRHASGKLNQVYACVQCGIAPVVTSALSCSSATEMDLTPGRALDTEDSGG
jgi:hypothetical protein